MKVFLTYIFLIIIIIKIIVPYFNRVIQSAKMKMLSTEALLKSINKSK